mgnify:CR=1 FL=1
MSNTAEQDHRWVAREFASLDLGDERLNARAQLLVERMVSKPDKSIPQVCADWAEAKAAYRFLSNDAVEPEAIRAAVRDACLQRVERERLVLIVQDTTSLDFRNHLALKGLGPTGGGDGSDGYGILIHSAIAVSEDGVPLGLLHQVDWVRDPENVGTRHERKQRSIEDKESFRWIKTMREVKHLVPASVTAIQMADREADIFELFAEDLPANQYRLIRAAHNRRISEEAAYLMDAVAAAERVGEFTVTVRRGNERPPREAHIVVSLCTVTLQPPSHGVHDPGLQPVTLTAIVAQEIHAPAGQAPVCWILLTDLPVTDFEGARKCIHYYTQRWLIERYHYTLKSGCRIEKSQVRSVHALRRLQVLYSVVALRLLWITYAARADGDQPCTVAFSTVEWQTLYRYHCPGKPLPTTPPTLRQATRWNRPSRRLPGTSQRSRPGGPSSLERHHAPPRLRHRSPTPNPPRCG